jgi:hypothetical protein
MIRMLVSCFGGMVDSRNGLSCKYPIVPFRPSQTSPDPQL